MLSPTTMLVNDTVQTARHWVSVGRTDPNKNELESPCFGDASSDPGLLQANGQLQVPVVSLLQVNGALRQARNCHVGIAGLPSVNEYFTGSPTFTMLAK